MLNLSTSFRVMRLQGTIAALYDTAPPTLEVYDANIPSSADAAATGNLLARVTAVTPAPTVTSSSCSLAFVEGAVIRNGVPKYARLKSGKGAVIMDFDLGAEGSGAPVTYNTADFYEGGLLKVSSIQLTE